MEKKEERRLTSFHPSIYPSDGENKWLGFVTNCSGILGSLVLGQVAESFFRRTRKFKLFMIILYAFAGKYCSLLFSVSLSFSFLFSFMSSSSSSSSYSFLFTSPLPTIPPNFITGVTFCWFTLSLPVGWLSHHASSTSPSPSSSSSSSSSNWSLLPSAFGSLIVSSSLASFFLGGTTPISYEVGAELTFPISEGSSAGETPS